MRSLQKVQVGLRKAEEQRTKTARWDDSLSLKDTETLYMHPPVGARGTGAEARIINVWIPQAESTGVSLTPGWSCGPTSDMVYVRHVVQDSTCHPTEFRHLLRSQTAEPLSTSARQMGKGHLVGRSDWIQETP